jgi:hypothetical protein
MLGGRVNRELSDVLKMPSKTPNDRAKINFSTKVVNWNARSPPELKNPLPFRPTVRGMGQITDTNEGE